MEHAKRILPRLFLDGEEAVLEEIDLLQAYWEEAVGPLIASHSNPVSIESRKLTVEVDGQPWMELVEAMRDQIADCLRAELPHVAVRAIALRPAAAEGQGQASR